MNQGDKITIEYGKCLCNTCKHQETSFADPPCDECSIDKVLYEPEEESQ
jgi:hypothetical protein